MDAREKREEVDQLMKKWKRLSLQKLNRES